MATGKKKVTKKLTTTCYVKLQPQYTRGDLKGVKAAGLSQKAPRVGHCVKLRLSVPASVFEPFEAEVDVPASAVQCKVIPITEEAAE